MRPLVEFKKIALKPEGKLSDGIAKYKDSKQKESALQSLTDDNIDTIINGRKSSLKKFRDPNQEDYQSNFSHHELSSDSEDDLVDEIADQMVKTGVFDDTRFKGAIPDYEKSHFREYLASPEGYRENQLDNSDFNYEMRKKMEHRLKLHVD